MFFIVEKEVFNKLFLMVILQVSVKIQDFNGLFDNEIGNNEIMYFFGEFF